MARYIDIGGFLERGPMGVSMFISPDYANGYNDFCRELLKVPAADVEPVRHGRWLDGRCTVCAWEAPDQCAYDGYENTSWEETPYCPNCGAKMDKEDEK